MASSASGSQIRDASWQLLPGHVGGVSALSLSRDGSLVASGTFDSRVHFWETRDGRLIRSLRGHTGPVWSVAFSHNSGRLASGSFDGSLRLWDVSSGNTLHVMRIERRYERMDITQLRGITDAQRDALLVQSIAARVESDLRHQH
jgi:WD40 repeat protein